MKILSKAVFNNPLLWFLKINGLYVFNYHRIGEQDSTLFDPNVFSCNEEMFEKHLQFYKTNFDVINVEQLVDIINSKEKIKEKLALITFDDGYIDNYTIAFPLLKSNSVPATFFIATDFIDHKIIPWWDEIAFIVKNHQQQKIKTPQWSMLNQISELPQAEQIRLVLRQIKADSSISMKEKISTLKTAVNWQDNNHFSDEELFMSWPQIKEMYDNGMQIGSQSCSHMIMSHLSDVQQFNEAAASKKRIEEEINASIDSFAYPVGGTDCFNQKTIEILRKVGYGVAFSFMPDVNKALENPFDLARFSVDNNCSTRELKYRINHATLKNIF